MSPQSLLSTGDGSGLRGGEHLLKRARPYGKRRPFEERGVPLWGKGHAHFDLVCEKGRAPVAEGAPLWERALSKCHIENLTY